MKPPPVDPGTDTVYLLTSARHEPDPAHAWMQALIRKAAQTVGV